MASSSLYIFIYIVFVNKINQYNYDHFPYVSLVEFFSITLGDDLGKVFITAKLIIYNNKNIFKTIIPDKHFQYITEPLKSLIVTLSADSGLQNICSLYPKETK